MAEKTDFTDECVILKAMSYGEADRLVTVFSKKFGKKTLLAKGACRPNSKMCGFTDSLSILEYVPRVTKTFTIMTQPKILSPLFNIKQTGAALGPAFSVCELAMRGSEFDVPMPIVYDVLKDTLVIIDLLGADAGKITRVVLKFKLFFLGYLGFTLNLHNCQNCGGKLSRNYVYDGEAGGNICASCAAGRPAAFEASEGIAVLASIAEAEEMKYIIEFECSDSAILQAFRVLMAHMKAHLHFMLASENDVRLF